MSIRKLLSFILRCRLENVMAVAVSAGLLALFLTTRLFHAFSLGMHDFIFILLPVGVLGLKTLMGLLSASDDPGQNVGPGRFLALSLQPFVKIVRDWFPFLLLSACYFSLYSNLILRVNPHTADATLAKIDASILGNQASLLLESLIRPWLTDFLNLIYFSFVFYLPGMALYFYLRKDSRAFRRLMMGYLTLILMGVTSYLLVPAVGPDKFLAERFTHNLQGQTFSHGVDYIMQTARVAHDCFPSLHVGIPLLLAFYFRDYRRKLFIPAMVYVLLMCCATIYLRYHYMIDVLAAFAYAPTAYWLNDFLLARWPAERGAQIVPLSQSTPVPQPIPAISATQQP
jgi:membrane-associated phospholipid phosphatase